MVSKGIEKHPWPPMAHPEVEREREKAQAKIWDPAHQFPKRPLAFPGEILVPRWGRKALFWAHPPPNGVIFASILRQKQKLKDKSLESCEQRYRGGGKRWDKDPEKPRDCF